MRPTKIIVADDHPLLRSAVAQALQGLEGGVELLEAANFSALEMQIAAHEDADLVLLDLHMPGAKGFSALVFLRAQRPALPIVVISSDDDARTIRRSQQFGASGFIPKSAPIGNLLDAVSAVLAGEASFPDARAEHSPEDARLASQLAQLTTQQLRVLMCLAEGLQNKQISFQLGLAENTVKVHVTAILKKLGVTSRTRAALLAKALSSEPIQHADDLE